MADKSTDAETPNGNCGPPTDRFVSGWPRPGSPATAPRSTPRRQQSRACRGATAATALKPDGPSENRLQRHRVRSTDRLCWTSESFLGRGRMGTQPYSTPALPGRLFRFKNNSGVEQGQGPRRYEWYGST